MNFPEKLITKRLLLRRPILHDAETIFARYAQDDEVSKYLTWSPHPSVHDTEEFLERVTRDWAEGLSHQYVITLRDLTALDDDYAETIRRDPDRTDSGAIGMIGTHPTGQPHKLEFGYVLARAFWGRGYMSEALRTMIDASFLNPECHRVLAVCDVDNPASARVMEKAGMEREGLLRSDIILPNLTPKIRDVYIYGAVRPRR